MTFMSVFAGASLGTGMGLAPGFANGLGLGLGQGGKRGKSLKYLVKGQTFLFKLHYFRLKATRNAWILALFQK